MPTLHPASRRFFLSAVPGSALAVCLALGLTACGPTPTPPSGTASAPRPPGTATPTAPSATSAATSDVMALGRQVATQAFTTLSSNLLGALGRSTPAESLEFCSVNVAPLLASIPVPPGTTVRRVSHKPRNPANRASPIQLALIQAHAEALAGGHTNPPVLSPNPDGTVTFLAPILLGNPACLLCHGQPGTDIAPPTTAAIQRLYPADEAHGFRLGEIRGLWAITFPAPATAR